MEPGSDVSNDLRAWISEEALSARPDITLEDSTELLKSGYLDSLLLLRLVAHIEDRFGVEVPDDQVLPAHFRTIAAMTALIRELQQQTAPNT
jgi:2-hydroxymuconate-semialdehyde hydrolase